MGTLFDLAPEWPEGFTYVDDLITRDEEGNRGGGSCSSDSGTARSAWEHSIPPTKTLRYSVTFRTLASRHA